MTTKKHVRPKLKTTYKDWIHKCGFCGGKHPVGVTHKNMLVCSHCGRW